MVESAYMNKIVREIEALPEDAGNDKIAQTESELLGYHYSPVLTLEVPHFLTCKKTDLLDFLNNIPPTQQSELREEDLSLIVYHYKLLQKLRRNDPESWDIIMALMDDD